MTATTSEMIDALYHPIARTITDVLAGEEHAAELFLIDDEENILMAVRHGVQLECVVHTGSEGQGLSQELQEALGESAVPVHEMAVHVAKKLFGREKRTRLFALARKPDPAALADLAGAQGDIVVLDGVKLAGNIGAISRTACALGAAGLVLVESRPAVCPGPPAGPRQPRDGVRAPNGARRALSGAELPRGAPRCRGGLGRRLHSNHLGDRRRAGPAGYRHG